MRTICENHSLNTKSNGVGGVDGLGRLRPCPMLPGPDVAVAVAVAVASAIVLALSVFETSEGSGGVTALRTLERRLPYRW